MHRLALAGCTATPFGGYLKALGVLRLVAEQADSEARGFWDGDLFTMESKLTSDDLVTFFLDRYEPTPIVAPWNGGSGFYDKRNSKEPMPQIEASTHRRFSKYRDTIAICRAFPEVQAGKDADDVRRASILRRCRNLLCDSAVEWLDAVVGISADGRRDFAPILGTGGNEGNQDYTENHMARLVALLVAPSKKAPASKLLEGALFDTRTTALQEGAAGQFDPGHAAGANQGQKVKVDPITNPWDLVLTLEGAVSWASGLHRRQGTPSKTSFCSPFTVRSVNVGYGSASNDGKARAEIWAPVWTQPVRYAELKQLLREGRADLSGRPARNGLEFAEAACSLGVDRGIGRFVRYSMLERRGKGYYVALPTGTFPTGYRTESDRIREFQQFLDRLHARDLPKGADDLRRNVDSAIYQVLLAGGRKRMLELMAALGRMLRRLATTTEYRLPSRGLNAESWLAECDFVHVAEVRIAAAIASIYTREVGSIADNLSRSDKRFAWTGADLSSRMVSVLDRRVQSAGAADLTSNPTGGACALHPGDATLFIEGSFDDGLIEDLLFAFVTLDWKDFSAPQYDRPAEVLPTYSVLKHLFLTGEIMIGPEPKRLRADPRILSLLTAGNVEAATEIAVQRLRIAGFRPLDVSYQGGVDWHRLAASLLIPVWPGKVLASGIFHENEQSNEAYA